MRTSPLNNPLANDLRIVSFLPSATEMVCALGLADHLCGITHECDYPSLIKGKPVVVRPRKSLVGATPKQIDTLVRAQLQSGQSLYVVDKAALVEAAPTLILAQDLCQVCALSGNEITEALQVLRTPPRILWFAPKTLAGIKTDLQALGRATHREAEAQEMILSAKARLERVCQKVRGADRPRVFCMEWVDPIYGSGHWMPEMVKLAGGHDGLSSEARDSVRVEWTEVLKWAPEVLIINPCGFNLLAACEQARQLSVHPGWADLPAVRQNQVYAVDANSYFARPGPRVVDGVELLAHLIHPKLCAWNGCPDTFARIAC